MAVHMHVDELAGSSYNLWGSVMSLIGLIFASLKMIGSEILIGVVTDLKGCLEQLRDFCRECQVHRKIILIPYKNI